jgi:STE24 endopeptidase
VMGIAGPLRYVLLTDALLESLSGEQVEAVMAHELGHIRRRHMAWLGVSGLAAILLASAGVGWAAWVLPWPALRSEAAQSVLFLAGLPLAILWIGFVSRRFEWQADAFAVQHLSGARPGAGAVAVSPDAVVAMSGALEMVARLNHIPRHRFSFRHGSIAARQRRLRGLLGRAADRLPIDRQARVLKVVSGLAFVGAVLLVWQAGVS